jgi:plasmid stabilization system protein ParE
MIRVSPSAEADMKGISFGLSQFSENAGSKFRRLNDDIEIARVIHGSRDLRNI